MSDIFGEVDEEVRRDKAAELWKKYQSLVYAGAALIVLATAGYRFYEYHETQVSEAAGAAFQDALRIAQDGKPADAETAMAKVAAEAPAGYRMLARFAAAGEAEKGDASAGAAAFDALANDPSVDPLYREAARLHAALARLDAGDVDAAKGALETLSGPAAVFHVTARLTLGAIALDEHDWTSAGKWLDEVVADPTAPDPEKRTAETLLGIVASEAPAK